MLWEKENNDMYNLNIPVSDFDFHSFCSKVNPEIDESYKTYYNDYQRVESGLGGYPRPEFMNWGESKAEFLSDIIEKDYVIDGFEFIFDDKPVIFNQVDLTKKDFKESYYLVENFIRDYYWIAKVYLYDNLNETLKIRLVVYVPFQLQIGSIEFSNYIQETLKNYFGVEVEKVKSFKEINPLISRQIGPIEVVKSNVFMNILNEEYNKGKLNNIASVKIGNIVNKVRGMTPEREKLNDGIVRTKLYNVLNTMREGIDVKIPILHTRLSEDGLVRRAYSYEYLIPPVQNFDVEGNLSINKNLLNKLGIENFEINNDFSLYGGFSMQEMEILHQQYSLVTTLIRPLINYLRDMFEYLVDVNSQLYDVNQKYRLQENSRTSFNALVYESSFYKLTSFPNIVRNLVKKEVIELTEDDYVEVERALKLFVDKIKSGEASNKDNFPEFLRVYTNLLSIHLYSKLHTLDEESVMNIYNKLETIRESLRFNIFLNKVNIINNTFDFSTLINTFQYSHTNMSSEYSYQFPNLTGKKDSSYDINLVNLKIQNRKRESELNDSLYIQSELDKELYYVIQ